MIKLYYSPFSCSLAIHILLEIVKADYEVIPVQIGSDDFKQIAPKWAVPALFDDENNIGVMTQVPALLKYIAQKFQKNDLLGNPNSLEDEFKMNELLWFLNSDLHKSFGPTFMAKKYTTQTSQESIDSIKEAWVTNIVKQLWFLENMLDGKIFLLWNTLTIADIYAFVIVNWGNLVLPNQLNDFPNIMNFVNNMQTNSDVQKVLALHANK